MRQIFCDKCKQEIKEQQTIKISIECSYSFLEGSFFPYEICRVCYNKFLEWIKTEA